MDFIEDIFEIFTDRRGGRHGSGHDHGHDHAGGRYGRRGDGRVTTTSGMTLSGAVATVTAIYASFAARMAVSTGRSPALPAAHR